MPNFSIIKQGYPFKHINMEWECTKLSNIDWDIYILRYKYEKRNPLTSIIDFILKYY